MERIRESVEIKAAQTDVFALVSDLCRRARLNPAWRVIACEALDGGRSARGRVTGSWSEGTGRGSSTWPRGRL
jgi:hypothetical protein